MHSASLENLSIIAHNDLPGGYRLARLYAPQLAAIIQPGASIQTHAQPEVLLPCLRVGAQEAKIDLLFQLTPVTQQYIMGTVLSSADIIMQACQITNELIQQAGLNIIIVPAARLGAGIGAALNLPPLTLQHCLFLFELDKAAPFKLQPSQLYIPYLPANMIANMAILEEKKIAARFISQQGLPGCFEGSVNDCLDHINSKLTVAIHRINL